MKVLGARRVTGPEVVSAAAKMQPISRFETESRCGFGGKADLSGIEQRESGGDPARCFTRTVRRSRQRLLRKLLDGDGTVLHESRFAGVVGGSDDRFFLGKSR